MLRRYCLLALLSVAVVLPVQAQKDKDFLGLDHFPDARLLYDRHSDQGDYTLALGAHKKLGGRWVVDRERRLKGQINRVTLELPSDYSAREAFDFYLEQLKLHKLRQLYQCTGRECGGSSNWANSHFNVIQLHGLDQHQYYGVYEVVAARQVHYVTLYAVQRGNRRVYVQLDVVKPDTNDNDQIASNPDTLAQVLREQGYFVFPGLEVSGTGGDRQVELQSGHLDTLVQLLKQEPDWRIALVGHDYAGADLKSQREASLSYAHQLKAVLTERGLEANRLEVFGLGSLAPAGRGERSFRLEVVLL